MSRGVNYSTSRAQSWRHSQGFNFQLLEPKIFDRISGGGGYSSALAIHKNVGGGSAGLFNEPHLNSFSNYHLKTRAFADFSLSASRASQEPLDDNKNKFYKELGLFSLRKRIEDSILRAEMFGPTALELEEAKQFDREEVIRGYDLWEDLGKSNEALNKLAESAKVVDSLSDLKYKAEEAKLITELAEMDEINYALFKQAYSASLDVNKLLDQYEMSKLLKEAYDTEGACIIIETKCGDAYSERWAKQLVQMYMKWAKRQGHAGRIVESSPSNNGHLKSVTVELEFKFAYGYLSGESGIHSVIRSFENSSEASSASVDVIPLFIESSPELEIDDEDLKISHPTFSEENLRRNSSTVHIQHLPTGLEVQSTGERSRFANKIKAMNRLKAKLLVFMREGRMSSVESIARGAKMDRWGQEARRYVFGSNKMVHDLKSGVQLPDVNGVLNGNIDPLIVAHINSRQTNS